MGRAEVFLHRTAMERATGDFTGLRCGQTVQRSCNFEGVQTSRFGGLESVQARTQAAAVVFRRTHQSLRREMLDLADSARTQTNCQRTRPDFRNRQNFGTWTNCLEFGGDARNQLNVDTAGLSSVRIKYVLLDLLLWNRESRALQEIFKRFECRVIPCVGTKLQVASTRRGRGLLCLSVYGRIWEA